MAKLILSDLVNLQNETTVVSTINANNGLIETALNNTLSRDGTTPNEMSADIDMNSKKVFNLPAATSSTEPVRKTEFDLAVLGQLGNIPGPLTIDSDVNGILTIGRESVGNPWSLIRPGSNSNGLELRSFSGIPQVRLTQGTGNLELLTGGLIIDTTGTTSSLITGLSPTQFMGLGVNPGINFRLTDNPGSGGSAFYLHWNQRDSSGNEYRVVSIGPGLSSAGATAGALNASIDIALRINNNLHGIAIAGLEGQNKGGIIPDATAAWVLGQKGQGYTTIVLENSNGNAGPVSLEMRDVNSATAYRIRNSGASLIVQKNTAAGGDFSTSTNILVLSSSGLTGTFTGSVFDNTNTVTLKDNLFTLQDDGDATKQAVFQLSSISTGTTRTYTLPNSSGTVTLNDSTATLTNKTYDTAGTGNSFSINGVAATANTGTGSVVRATSPTLTTPVLGAATATTINGVSLDNNAWSTYTPTITSQGGTITSSTASGRFKQIGKTVFISLKINITTAGTGTGFLGASLPVAAQTTTSQFIGGAEGAVSGKNLQGIISSADATRVQIYDYNIATIIANGALAIMTGCYEAA